METEVNALYNLMISMYMSVNYCLLIHPTLWFKRIKCEYKLDLIAFRRYPGFDPLVATPLFHFYWCLSACSKIILD